MPTRESLRAAYLRVLGVLGVVLQIGHVLLDVLNYIRHRAQ